MAQLPMPHVTMPAKCFKSTDMIVIVLTFTSWFVRVFLDIGGLGALAPLLHVSVFQPAVPGRVPPLAAVVALALELTLSHGVSFRVTLRRALERSRSRKDLSTGTLASGVPFSWEGMAFSFLSFAL